MFGLEVGNWLWGEMMLLDRFWNGFVMVDVVDRGFCIFRLIDVVGFWRNKVVLVWGVWMVLFCVNIDGGLVLWIFCGVFWLFSWLVWFFLMLGVLWWLKVLVLLLLLFFGLVFELEVRVCSSLLWVFNIFFSLFSCCFNFCL